jgi:hypothetical protein
MGQPCLQSLDLGFQIDHALAQRIAACACRSGCRGHGIQVHGAAQQMRPALLARAGRARQQDDQRAAFFLAALAQLFQEGLDRGDVREAVPALGVDAQLACCLRA